MTTTTPSQSNEIEPREKAELVTEDTRPGWVFRPDVDILETAEAYTVLADVPGADEESIEIQLEKGVLTLDARLAEAAPPVDQADEEAETSPRAIHAEYRSGGYHREFRISEDIDPAAVSAKMKDGVLELRLPKSAESKPRRINVQAA